jgi:protein YIPF6
VAQSENVELTDRDKQIIESLRDWDLWGPLLVCLALAVLLSFDAPVGQASLVFATVFCAVWFGAAVITINTQLLGGTISFFQSVCVLGYCVFPMTMAAVVVMLFKMLPLGAFSVLVEIAVLLVAFLWSTRASSVFIGQYIVASRRVLAVGKTSFWHLHCVVVSKAFAHTSFSISTNSQVFPVLFFYTFLAWLVLLF